MEFKNRPNTYHKIDGRVVWESRSVAVNGVILINVEDFDDPGPYALVAERGPKAADFRGLWNNVAGYLDYDESGTEAIIRETWEEVGINLHNLIDQAILVHNVDIQHPWHTETDPLNNDKQNVSLRYGVYTTQKWFPVLSTANNELPGEVGKMKWVHLNELHWYKWAFDHDKVIRAYYEFVKR